MTMHTSRQAPARSAPARSTRGSRSIAVVLTLAALGLVTGLSVGRATTPMRPTPLPAQVEQILQDYRIAWSTDEAAVEQLTCSGELGEYPAGSSITFSGPLRFAGDRVRIDAIVGMWDIYVPRTIEVRFAGRGALCVDPTA